MRMEGCPGMGSVPGTQHQPWLEGERVRGTEVLLHPAWGSLSSWAAGFDPQPPLPPLPLSPGALLLNKRVSLQWLVCTEKGLFGGGGKQANECKCQGQSQVALFECKCSISGIFQLETKGW